MKILRKLLVKYFVAACDSYKQFDGDFADENTPKIATKTFCWVSIWIKLVSGYFLTSSFFCNNKKYFGKHVPVRLECLIRTQGACV